MAREAADRVDRAGRPGRPAAGDGSGRPGRTSRSDRTDRTGRTDRGEPRHTRGRGQAPAPPKVAGWGGVARKGAGVVGEDKETASGLWKQAVEKAREARYDKPEPEAWEPEIWIEDAEDVTPAPRPAKRPATRGRRGGATPAPASDAGAGASTAGPERRGKKLPAPVVQEVERATGPRRSARVAKRLADATRAYEREHYQEARQILRQLAEEAPDAPAIRQLFGLTLYNLERWALAAKELEAYRALSGDFDAHPVLADCYRAMRRWAAVDALWEELRQASPGAELVAEGRIVAAGALADRRDLAGAIALLEKAKLDTRHPRPHHLRLWYALADLYERAGDVPHARQLFRRVLDHDPDFFDAGPRLRGLG